MNLEAIFKELKTLPPQRLERAADYIHRLHSSSRVERKGALRRTAGSLTGEEADDLAGIIEKGCEQIDERDR
ncbi:MAG: hypothetical protein ACR2NN_20915 [Bryobacteraceae bacterium]